MSAELEKKIDDHIAQHDVDYKKLLWWIITTLITLLIASAGGFVTIGNDQQRILQLEKLQEANVSKVEFTGTIALWNNKMDNMNEKLDSIKGALNIR